jgi:hypothetical protein
MKHFVMVANDLISIFIIHLQISLFWLSTTKSANRFSVNK